MIIRMISCFDFIEILFLQSLICIILHEFVLTSPQYDLVIDVGNIDLVQNVKMEIVFHDAAQNIKGQIGSGVAHVAGIVHGWSTCVPGYRTIFSWSKRSQLVGNQAVVDQEVGQIAVVVLGWIPSSPSLFLHKILAEALGEPLSGRRQP